MAIDDALSPEQKKNLEEARRILGFRSRNRLIVWFADNAVEIAQSQLTGVGFIDQEIQSLVDARNPATGE